ncbi:hypothetical protein ACFGYG_04925 [Pasteurella multocida]|nr:hypothetical protein [Pasteurella multocida]HDR1874094.1 hypothetical protein [Pasteurella multocida]HED4406649.1 hypothetical protein [Pasteurella multocida]
MSLFNRLSSTPNSFQQSQLPSVQLALDGKPIYLRNFKASVSFTREEKDMSGQKSSTKKSDKGVKAKKLKVSGMIPYADVEWLKTLMQFAEAVDDKNEQKKYRLANRTAEAVNMREAVFSGEVSITESAMQAWDISFELSEVNSVAEKKEQRANKPAAKVQRENVHSSSESGNFWDKLNQKDNQ